MGCFSFTSINKWFLGLDFNETIARILSFIFTPLVHLILDFSAREAIGTNCLFIPNDFASNTFLHIGSTLFFLCLHLFCFVKLIKWIINNSSKKGLYLLIPFVILLPTLYGPAHMRYLIPLIPALLIFGFIKPKDRINLYK